MGWERVWTLALAQFGAEAIELRILIGLGIAFCVLMIVEGLRACFAVRRPAPAAMPAPPLPQRILAPAARDGVPPPQNAFTQPARVRTVVARAVPKRARRVSPHQAVRPRIRRPAALAHQPHYTDGGAPFSPLSPQR